MEILNRILTTTVKLIQPWQVVPVEYFTLLTTMIQKLEIRHEKYIETEKIDLVRTQIKINPDVRRKKTNN